MSTQQDANRGLDPALIAHQVTRILSSREFVRSDRMARFLRYIVECQIEGRTNGLKERSIGIEVFDRSTDWDPKLDNIVRSEARRLRAKLEQYYVQGSAADAVRITMPKGAYAPNFEVEPARQEINYNQEQRPEPVRARTPEEERPSRWRFYVALVAVLALVSALGLYSVSGRREASVPVGLAQTVPFANEIGTEINPAISADGKFIAYAWDGNRENYDIYVKSAEGGPDVAPKRLTNNKEADLYPAWSPDDRRMAFVRMEPQGAAIVLKDLAKGDERGLTHVHQRNSGWLGENAPYVDIGPSWLPDGRSLVITDMVDKIGTGLYRVNLAQPDQRELIRASPAGHRYYFPRVSPNGREVAFVSYTSHGVSDLYLCAIDGSNLRRLTTDRRGINGLAWTPDGGNLYYAAWRQGSSRILRIRAIPGSEPEPMPDSAAATEIAVSRGGELIAYASVTENWNIWRMALDQSGGGTTLGRPQRLIASSGRNHGPSFSPDGRQLAFISDRTGGWQIWLADPSGEHPRQVTRFDGGFLGSVNWTPDSRMIAFDARKSENSNIYLLDITRGGASPVALNANRFEERMPSWSADGKAIYFNSNRDGMVAVWRRTMADGSMRKVGLPTSFKSLSASTGKALYFNLDGGTLYRAGVDGSAPSELPGVVAMPEINWVLSEETLYYTQQEASGQIAFWMFRGGKSSLAARVPGQLVRSTSNLAVSPDRKWLLYALQDHSSSDLMVRKTRGAR